jgi:hypothetical protein
MKRVITFFIMVMTVVLPVITTGQTPSLELVREQFFRMKQVNNGALNLFFRLKSMDLEKLPVLMAYRGAASAASAGSVTGPYKKLQYFSDGKKELEQAIQASPANAEIRFLRLVTQLNAPAFLGYNHHVEADKKLVINTLALISKNDPNAYLYYHISEFLIGSGILSQMELKDVAQSRIKFKQSL